jgi:hypothetical protein
MKLVILFCCGLVLLLAGILIHFETTQWSLVLIDTSLTNSTKPAYILDADRKEAYVFTSEVSAILGVILTSIAAFRWAKVP